MVDHAEKCFERCCELAEKDLSSLQQEATPCIYDHQKPPEDDGTTYTQDTHSQYTAVQYSLFTGAERTRRAWLKASTAQVITDCISSSCAWKESCHLVLHMSHPLLFSHLPFTTSTSSSSFTLPSTTTPEHAAQPVQHDQLREHPVHHATSPSSPSRQAAPPRITLAWRPAEWRKPAHDNSHWLWAQRACDCLEDRRLYWRSISIIWCTGKIRRRRSPSTYHRRSGGIWRERDSWPTGF